MAYTFKHGDRPLDDYTIQRAVGRGGFGEVYYAVSDGGREVALKYLRENPQVELRGVSHCINLKSPHLVSIFDVKKNADGDYFIVMEYVSGPSLRDLLVAEPGGLGPQKAAFFVREIAKGLAYLHDRGIVHRDLKPGNIFYDEGYVKIGDYGLSKFISISRHSAQTASVGTVHYMAPEVGSGNYHRGIDIYALGVMLYEMLLGKVPFEGGSMGEVLMKHLTEQPEVADLPEPFGKVIRKALQKDPRDRYQTVYEMAEDLLAVQDVRASLVGFNPATLSMIEQRGAADVARSPSPSPNPVPKQVPPIDSARGPRRPFDLDAQQLPPKLVKRISATSEKVTARLRKLNAKHGRRTPEPPPQRPTVSQGPAAPQATRPRTRAEAFQRLLLALTMAVGLGFGIGLLVNAGEEGYAAAIMLIVGMSGGLALGCRCVAYFSSDHLQPRWVERICLTAPVAALTIIGATVFAESNAGRVGDRAFAVWGALVLVTFIARWQDRIAAGASGELSLGKAIWVGALALGLTAALSRGSNRCMYLAGGVGAASSLVVQALAWLFPLEQWLSGVPARLSLNIAEGQHRHPRRPRHATFLWRQAVPDGDPNHVAEHHPGPFENDQPIVGDEEVPSFVMNSRRKRWLLTRVMGVIVGLGCLAGTVACTIQLFAGRDHHRSSVIARNERGKVVSVSHRISTSDLSPRQRVGTAIGGATCLGISLLAFRKTTRYKTGGFYRDSLRPVLMTVALAAMAGSALDLSTGRAQGARPLALVAVFILSAMFCLFLLVKRGRKPTVATSEGSPEPILAAPAKRLPG